MDADPIPGAVPKEVIKPPRPFDIKAKSVHREDRPREKNQDAIFQIRQKRAFGEITDEEIIDFSKALIRIIQIFDIRHGHEFPFNFYIYPGGDWYLRLIPRLKKIGGFELGTGIYINTQDPKETLLFIKAHFVSPDHEKIKKEHSANYRKSV